MDPLRFHRLSRALAAHGPRRGVLGLLAAVPVVGGLLGILAPEETEAAGRRKRRKKRHKHGKGRRRDHGTHKQKCKAESIAQTCANTCGSVTNNCKKTVACGSCTCIPLTQCPAGKECGTFPDGCGGVVNCPFFCANPTPICTDNVCLACTGSDQCASGETCDDGSCETCDVCATGCDFTSVQAAVDAASSGDTVRICAGTYGLSTGSAVASIGENLTLIGAGADATILDGDNAAQVLQIGNVTVTLQDLTVTKGYGDLGGGIYNGGALTLNQVDVTANLATYGAGIYSSADGTVTVGTGSRVTLNSALNQGGGIAGGMTLRTGSVVRGNSAPNGGGGFYALFGSVTVDPGAVICSNTPLNDQCGGPFSGTCPAPNATCP